MAGVVAALPDAALRPLSIAPAAVTRFLEMAAS
jgi:hypothetical protein